MERKRVAGRFVAEDKGGVVRPRKAAHVTKPEQLHGVEPKDFPVAPVEHRKGLFGLLRRSFKRTSAPSADTI